MSTYTTQSRKGSKRDRIAHSSAATMKNYGGAKKGGGGGKHTWGRAGDEINIPEMDPGDPCYEHEEDNEPYILVSREDEIMSAAVKAGVETRPTRSMSGSAGICPNSPPRNSYDPSKFRQGPPVTLQEFKEKEVGILSEFFINGVTAEVQTSLEEMCCPVFHYEFVKKAITLSMDKSGREREMVCRLLSDLYGLGTLSSNQVGKAFERLFEQADDLELDAPDFRMLLCNYLARAVVDEVLPPCFLQDPMVVSLGGDIVEQSKVLLTRKHGIARIERIWGPGDGRDVSELKEAVQQLLHEFILSKDVREAARCVQELNAKQFHHEVVKSAIVIGMDGDEERRNQISSFFAFLFKQEIIATAQMEKGFSRIVHRLPDDLLDVPAAPSLLRGFLARGVTDGFLSEKFQQAKLVEIEIKRMEEESVVVKDNDFIEPVEPSPQDNEEVQDRADNYDDDDDGDEKEFKNYSDEMDIPAIERLPENEQIKINETEKKLKILDKMVRVVVFDQSPETMEEKILGKMKPRVPHVVHFNIETTTVGELKKIVLKTFDMDDNERALRKIKLVKNSTFLHPDEKFVNEFLQPEVDKHFCNSRRFGWKSPYTGAIWLVPNHLEPSNDAMIPSHWISDNESENSKEKKKVKPKKKLKSAVRNVVYFFVVIFPLIHISQNSKYVTIDALIGYSLEFFSITQYQTSNCQKATMNFGNAAVAVNARYALDSAIKERINKEKRQKKREYEVSKLLTSVRKKTEVALVNDSVKEGTDFFTGDRKAMNNDMEYGKRLSKPLIDPETFDFSLDAFEKRKLALDEEEKKRRRERKGKKRRGSRFHRRRRYNMRTSGHVALGSVRLHGNIKKKKNSVFPQDDEDEDNVDNEELDYEESLEYIDEDDYDNNETFMTQDEDLNSYRDVSKSKSSENLKQRNRNQSSLSTAALTSYDSVRGNGSQKRSGKQKKRFDDDSGTHTTYPVGNLSSLRRIRHDISPFLLYKDRELKLQNSYAHDINMSGMCAGEFKTGSHAGGGYSHYGINWSNALPQKGCSSKQRIASIGDEVGRIIEYPGFTKDGVVPKTLKTSFKKFSGMRDIVTSHRLPLRKEPVKAHSVREKYGKIPEWADELYELGRQRSTAKAGSTNLAGRIVYREARKNKKNEGEFFQAGSNSNGQRQQKSVKETVVWKGSLPSGKRWQSNTLRLSKLKLKERLEEEAKVEKRRRAEQRKRMLQKNSKQKNVNVGKISITNNALLKELSL
eukprot:g2098.t1